MSRAEHAGKGKKRHIIMLPVQKLRSYQKVYKCTTGILLLRETRAKQDLGMCLSYVRLAKTTNSDKLEPQTRETKTEIRKGNTDEYLNVNVLLRIPKSLTLHTVRVFI